MKAITALTLLKRHKLINERMRLSDLKFIRRLFGISRWDEFVRHIMFVQYLNEDFPMPEAITIPEVGLSVGGTLRIDIGRLESYHERSGL